MKMMVDIPKVDISVAWSQERITGASKYDSVYVI